MSSTASVTLESKPSSPYPVDRDRRLRLLSYNIQSGITYDHYAHYLTRSWRHVVPHGHRTSNLDNIAAHLDGYDVVALQECDSGSLRTGYTNQTEYLACRSRFPYWVDQTNRRLGRLARHSNGLLTTSPATPPPSEPSLASGLTAS